MQSSSVEVPTPDGVADAYLARPDERTHPGVLLLMDAYGLRPAVYEMADRIAAGGYVVLAPNLFYRAGQSPLGALPDLSDPEQRSRLWDKLRPMMGELTPDRIASDGGAYLDYLADAGADGPVAITGYCMGARIGWRIAVAHADHVCALAGFHAGRLVTDAPDSPHLSAGELRAELYFGFADEDPSMTPEQISTLDKTLEETGARYRSEVYEGAQHGYTMVDTPAHNDAARERHFRELSSLLNRVLPHPAGKP